MTYADLLESLRILELGERATIKEIKARHRDLVKRHHPDTANSTDPDMIKKINSAYRVIQDYISDYRFSFREDEFYEQNPEERIWQQFADDPLWGKK